MNVSKSQSGFTLAELLIAIGILGVIATFTIPKVLQTQQNTKRRAVFKETISMLHQIVYEGVSQGNIRWSGTGYNGVWILGKVNATKICDGNSEVEGCWDTSRGTLGESTSRGFVLPNGAVVVGGGLNPDDAFTYFHVDWNGTEGPNLPQQDQIGLIACYDTVPCTYWGEVVKPGNIIPLKATLPDNSDSRPLYEEIFSK